jgi:hypothetical protein
MTAHSGVVESTKATTGALGRITQLSAQERPYRAHRRNTEAPQPRIAPVRGKNKAENRASVLDLDQTTPMTR